MAIFLHLLLTAALFIATFFCARARIRAAAKARRRKRWEKWNWPT